jgi:hypothetical protein
VTSTSARDDLCLNSHRLLFNAVCITWHLSTMTPPRGNLNTKMAVVSFYSSLGNSARFNCLMFEVESVLSSPRDTLPLLGMQQGSLSLVTLCSCSLHLSTHRPATDCGDETSLVQAGTLDRSMIGAHVPSPGCPYSGGLARCIDDLRVGGPLTCLQSPELWTDYIYMGPTTSNGVQALYTYCSYCNFPCYLLFIFFSQSTTPCRIIVMSLGRMRKC